MINNIYSFLTIALTAIATYALTWAIRILLLKIRAKMVERIIKNRTLSKEETTYFRLLTLHSNETLFVTLILPVLFFGIFAVTVFILKYINIDIASSITSFNIISMAVIYVFFVSIVFFNHDYNHLDHEAQYINSKIAYMKDRDSR